MKLVTYPLYIIWRIWFYLMAIIPLVIALPLLIALTIRSSSYPVFFKVARLWGTFVLYVSGLIPKKQNGTLSEPGKSFMIVANHTSMIDIMFMLHMVKNPFVFVAKKELAQVPILGFFLKQACILVDRNDPKSRRGVFDRAQARIDQGLSVCIFPEGGVPDDESIVLDTFKDGAFRLAINHQLPIKALVFPDNKKRFSYTFFSGSPGVIRSYILPVIEVSEYTLKEKGILKEQVYNKIHTKLLELE